MDISENFSPINYNLWKLVSVYWGIIPSLHWFSHISFHQLIHTCWSWMLDAVCCCSIFSFMPCIHSFSLILWVLFYLSLCQHSLNLNIGWSLCLQHYFFSLLPKDYLSCNNIDVAVLYRISAMQFLHHLSNSVLFVLWLVLHIIGKDIMCY